MSSVGLEIAQVRTRLDGACEYAAVGRTICDHSDAELPACLEDAVLLNVERGRAVLQLNGCDRMDGMSAPNRGGADLANGYILGLACFDEFSYCSDALLNRNASVGAVKVKHVHVWKAETLQNLIARLAETAMLNQQGPTDDVLDVLIGITVVANAAVRVPEVADLRAKELGEHEGS